MVSVVQPNSDSHRLPPTLPERIAWQLEVGEVAGYSQEAPRVPSRASCMSPEVVTHICVTKAYKCGISDLQVSFAKVLLAEVFVCKIVMLMRPSDGFFFFKYPILSGNFCWQKGRKKSTLSPGRKNVSTV